MSEREAAEGTGLVLGTEVGEMIAAPNRNPPEAEEELLPAADAAE